MTGKSERSSTAAPPPMPLAIVGMSCRMPGKVASLDDFWNLLANSKDGYKEFPKDRFNWEAYYHPNQARKDSIHVKNGYFLDEDVANFDAQFFRMNATDASSFDPQGRIILECVYEALENAGIPKESVAGTKVGVFSTSNTSDYTLELKDDTCSMPSMVGVLGHGCMLSNVVSNAFDLVGPSVSVDTACSSAFYALQLAAQSLRSGETETCIVSGCALNLSPWRWTMLSNLTMLHPDGITKALDPNADSGYARGEGAASIILKPLDLAIRDNDRVHCVLSHVGVNHNGHTNGYTMPDAGLQAQLMQEVQTRINVKPDEFGFVEAHAPGTRVGDPIEVSAIQKVFSSDARTPEEPLLIGSVKANVGHLESSSGFPSLLKAALMLKKGMVVPNANFKDESMNSELKKLNMRVPISTEPWPKNKPYVAINNYGFGGANAHCIMQAAPVHEPDSSPGGSTTGAEEDYLFVLSANDETALARTREQLVQFLESDDATDIKMHDLAYTLGQRRSQLSWRAAVIASDLDDLAIQTASPRVVQRRVGRAPKIAFAFTGQGAQKFGMGRELLQYPIFSAALEMASACVESFGANFSLLEELYANEATTRINDADVSQPASTAIQIALVDLLRSWGVEPMAVVGHSSGEVAAAYAAGILSLPGAMRIAYARGQMAIRIKTVQPDFKGGMMAVAAGLEDIVPLLDIITSGIVVVGCENSPKSITVSGEESALEELETLLEEDGLPHRRLAVPFPYHSPFLEPYIDQYEEDICTSDTFSGTQQKAEYFSAMAGRRVEAAAVQKPSYWANSAKFRVRFTSAMTALLKSKTPPEVIIEVGPNPTLLGGIKSILKVVGKQVPHTVEVLASLQHGGNARTAMVKLAASLFGFGQGLDLEQINILGGKENGSRPQLVDGLKPYPWTRSRYWIESRVRDQVLLRPLPRHDLLGHETSMSNDVETVWKNNFDVEDVPWLQGHQVGPLVTFPLAGYVSAALEASRQRVLARGLDSDTAVTGYTVRDLHIIDKLVIEEGVRVELMIKLRALANSDAEEFELLSWNEGQQKWTQHCRALVTCHKQEGKTLESADKTAVDWASAWDSARTRCHKGVSSSLLYQGSAKTGPRRTGMFRNVYNLRYGEGKTTAEVVVSDTGAVMPQHYESSFIIHPTTLDGILQCGGYVPFLDEEFAPVGGASNVWVPKAVDEVRLLVGSGEVQKPGQVLQTVGCVEQGTQRRGGTYKMDAVAEGARVHVRGLQLAVEESLALQWPEPHYGCYKQEWQACGELPAEKVQWHVLAGPGGDNTQTAAALNKALGSKTVGLGDGLPAEAKFCIVVDVGEGLLGSAEPAAYETIKQAITTCDAVVWVTRGAFYHASNPTAGMVVGLLRTVRSEMQALVASLDLDGRGDVDGEAAAALVGRVAGHVAAAAKRGDIKADLEFSEDAGKLLVARVVRDEVLDENVQAATGVVAPRAEAFDANATRGVFALQRPGVTDSLYLQRIDEDDTRALGDGEVEVRVEAVALGADDAQTLQGRAFSGTVVRRGAGVTRVGEGERVFGLADGHGAFATFAIARETSLGRVPHGMASDTAAALPATLGAAHLLVDVARLRKGERAVVVAAGSAVGQATVRVALAAGAQVVAVVDSSAERPLDLAALAAGLGLPADCVVDSLDTVAPADVLLRPALASAPASAHLPRALAPMGRFVQLGDIAWDAAPRFPATCSIAAANLHALADALPARMADLIDAVANAAGTSLVPPSVETLGLDRLSDTLAKLSHDDPVVHVLVPAAGNIVKTTPAHPPRPAFDPAAVYLLIGGGGGLGRVIARWMVDNGARHIGLLSRTASMTPEVRKLADETATKGAQIFLLPCDVTDIQQVKQAVDQCTTERGPVKGVINAAMVFRGGVFSSVSHDDFNAVIQPKVRGTWNLHHALSDAPLDFFILISSVAGVMGTPGHSAYAAANTFLDSFARYRTLRGLPATSLALTAVVDAGYMAENAAKLQKLKYVDEFEGEILTTQDVLALLSATVNGQTASSCEGFCITGAGFGSARKLPPYAKDPRFSALLSRHAKDREQGPSNTAASNSSSLARSLDMADDKNEATRVLLNALRVKVAELQLIPVTDILDNITFNELGLDSLTGMELYTWIGRALRLKFRIQEYAKLDTLEKLVDCVMEKRETEGH